MGRKAMILVVAAVTLAACGGQPRPAGPAASPSTSTSTSTGTGTGTSTGTGTASGTPPHPQSPAASPTTGSGTTGAGPADDVNGDGHADLVAEFGPADARRLAIVPGSPRGLVPAKGVVVPPETFTSWSLGGGSTRGDFDGDGYGDVLGYGAPQGPEQAQGPHLLWGGPGGVAARTRPTPVRLPVASGPASYRAVAGDFDGDGAADLAVATPPEPGGLASDLTLLYGPFTRQGAAARSDTRPSPTGEDFWRMTADDIDGRRATALIVHQGDDGEQTSGVLLTAGPDGLARTGRKLNPGMAVAFGDFDGDGTRDVAVGDDGSRNDEPGYETEPPSVDRTLTVYYGNGRQAAFKGSSGTAVAGDFDGDGHDDLAFGRADPIPGSGGGRDSSRDDRDSSRDDRDSSRDDRGSGDTGASGLDTPGGGVSSRQAAAPKVFRGGPHGLQAGTEVSGLGAATPLAAGDYDGDGDDELTFVQGDDDTTIVVTDGKKVLARFGTADVPS